MTEFFLGTKITVDSDAAMKLKDTYCWKEHYDKPRQHIKKESYHFANKGLYSQSYGFYSSSVFKSWTIKKAEHRRTDAFELQ